MWSYELPYTGRATTFVPEDVQATSDGGDVLLGDVVTSTGLETTWIVKRDADGATRWMEDLGCLGLPPGSYTDGVSMDQTSDGGFVVAGGTIGCGSHGRCPHLGGVACAIVEKVSASGAVTWARVYDAGYEMSALASIRETADGGYIAVGSSVPASGRPAALVLKLDSGGGIEWERRLGLTGTAGAYLNGVAELASGDYVAVGDRFVPAGGVPETELFVVALDTAGDVVWQKELGTPGAVENGFAALVAPSGGDVLVGGNWVVNSPGSPVAGGLLVELGSTGSVVWQRAYSGGDDCVGGTCVAIGAVVYSVRPAPGGGYLLAGDADLELVGGGAQLVPWMAGVGATGALVWQHLYFETEHMTGRPLSEYFAAGTGDGAGVTAVGYTENYSNGDSELYVVHADSSGAVPGCADVQPVAAIAAVAPGLVERTLAMPIDTTISPAATSPATARAATAVVRHACA